LMYYRARYYQPRLQRFLAEDPLGIGDDDVNLYAYARNSPTILVDPLGEAGQQKGERGQASKPDGTPSPFKKLRPDPNDPSKVIRKDPHSGKEVRIPKPPGFDEYWKKKHGKLPPIRCLGPLLIVDPETVLCAINPMLCPCTDESCL
ncbi:MAG: RHS repeat-associated core domain-containing protein, partial [Nitrospira sp.]